MAFIKECRKGNPTSKGIKASLFRFYRYEKKYLGVLSEFNSGDDIEDFIAFRNNEITAIEIKVSQSDFLADFRTKKKYDKNILDYNYFYFCIPSDMVNYVCQYLQENNLAHIGVISYSYQKDRITIISEAKLLRPKEDLFDSSPEKRKLLIKLLKRMSSELTQEKLSDKE